MAMCVTYLEDVEEIEGDLVNVGRPHGEIGAARAVVCRDGDRLRLILFFDKSVQEVGKH